VNSWTDLLTMTDASLKTIVTSEASADEVCFWTGAGISANKPSCLPLGDSLTEKTIEHFCLPGTWSNLVEYFGKAKMEDSFGHPKITPRLELVLESITQVLGPETLTFLDPFLSAKPNSLHRFFAKHLENGGTHVTTNFDSCIEKCLTSDNKEQAIHIHGKYGRENLEDLGVRIRTIASGLPQSFKERITYLLSRCRYLVFCGYSGRDYFDVNPFFSELKEGRKQFRNLAVIWVKHVPRKKKEELVPWSEQREGKLILDALRNCGARIFYLLVHTDQFLDMFREIWGSPYKDSELIGECIDERYREMQGALEAPISVSENEKILATAQLYSSMGVGREVIALSDGLLRIVDAGAGERSLRSKAYLLLNNGFRDAGLYKQAQEFSRLLPTSTLEERMSFHDRAAGDYWLQGDHLRAAYHFLRGILLYGRRFDELGDDNEKNQSVAGVYYESIITFLHWYRDAKKLPLIGKLLPLCLAVRAFQRLAQAKEFVLKNPHARAKLIRLRDEIPGLKKGTSLPSWIRPAEVETTSHFQETDSILGVVNFSRREIELGIGRGEMPERDSLEILCLRSRLIGDRPGVLKAALLLKQIYGSDVPGAIDTLKETEWVRLEKIRWLLKWHWAGLKRPEGRG